jgi:hypothetical protein
MKILGILHDFIIFFIGKGSFYPWYDLEILHIIFFILNIFMWVSLFHASTSDPGYLPRNVPEYDLAIKQEIIFPVLSIDPIYFN